MFEHLVKILNEHGNGVRGYSECARAAEVAARNTPDLVAPYFFLGIIAQRFVETFEGEPLTSDKASRELALFEDYAAKLGDAFTKGEDGDKLKALNSVAGDFFNRSV